VANIVILIPSFNSADTIGATLESVQGQGAQLARIAAVYIADDCSTDDTIAVAEASWKVAVPLLVLERKQNLGECRNVNLAMTEMGEGTDWVLILHSDDIASQNWLQVMVSRIETCSQGVGSICSSWDTLLPDGAVIPGEDGPDRPIEVIQGDVESVRGTLLKGTWWHISGCAIRMSAFKDVGGLDPKFPYLGDWEWLLRYLHRGWAVEYIPRTLITYRRHLLSVSSKSLQVDRDIKASLEILCQYYSLLTDRELLSFHLRRVSFVVRRMERSLIRCQPRRLLLSGQTLWLVVTNLIRCLARSRKR